MITTAEEYYANLFKINESGNLPSLATLLPRTENIYSVNLNTRTIESPEFLSVVDDHNSETIYFLVDRFFDNIDLSTTACVIQYINAKGEGRLYSVPFYDIETFHAMDKMLIPWCIEGEATKASGNVTYSIRFFKVDATGKFLIYNLNTLPATSKVLVGINILDYELVSDLTKEQFDSTKNDIKYYIKENGAYKPAPEEYSEKTSYYILINGREYESELWQEFLNRLNNIEKDYNLYWYEG